MKYMRRTAGYSWTDYKTNAQIAKELKITPILDKLLEYKRNWIQHVNRMPRNRLPRVMKHYSPNGRRNHGRPLKRLLDRRPEWINKWSNSMTDIGWISKKLCKIPHERHKHITLPIRQFQKILKLRRTSWKHTHTKKQCKIFARRIFIF